MTNSASPASGSPASGVAVQVRGLCKAFGPQTVLDQVNLEVAPGEIFVLMGPSGSGKSVLLKHVVGLEIPDTGEILVDGRPVQSEGLMDAFRVAMVFQSGALLNSLSVGENVGLYLTEHRLKSAEEIQRVVAEKLELVGLKGVEDRNPAELSGGMRKRVAIARALVIDPQLILYDEPTSELDPLSAITIGEEIVNLRDRTGATSIVVTHDRDLAMGVADRMAFINQGRILFLGTSEQARGATDPVMRRFLTTEFKPRQSADG